jgi:outer membrane receptor for ferrienterochelin and colicins
MKIKLILPVFLLNYTLAFAQEDSALNKDLDLVVVTATRSERQLTSLPMPMTVIDKKQIQQMGSMRLGQVLAEQTGLFVVSDHGKGIQLQGFNPDYTLILVDGEPLIGRTGGTLELDRLAVGNIKQIEIVKGPSSSLYGSEALAGVINIITEDANKTGGIVNARYGANQTADLSFMGNLRKEKLSLSLFLDRYSSGGYDLTPETFGNTVAPFVNYTVQPKLSYALSKKTSLMTSARLYKENQKDAYDISLENGVSRMLSKGNVSDENYNFRVKHAFSKNLNLTARTYLSSYATQSSIRYTSDNRIYDESFFNQTFVRPELLIDYNRGERHFFLFGTGTILESVEATRYDDQKKFTTQYAFAQYEWYATDKLQFNAGGRYDAHSAYRNQFSPKLAAIYKITSSLKARASYGVGYKAPDFRQLYLNFTNAVAGYSVFGAHELYANFLRLQAEGQIATVFQDPSSFGELQPESSHSFNAGLLYTHTSGRTATINAFRNDVRDLIESFPVAQKVNGQSMFSYRNIAEVYTQGLEINGSQPVKIGFNGKLTISAGYQFLEAKDKSIERKIKAGNVYRRNSETLATERVTKSDYGGLVNRSKHSANIKFFYQFDNGFSVNLRSILRGRYGFLDRNGNGIIDADDEYAKGYMILNLSASQHIKKNFMIQSGIDNLLNFRDAMAQPGQPGTQWWIRGQFTF